MPSGFWKVAKNDEKKPEEKKLTPQAIGLIATFASIGFFVGLGYSSAIVGRHTESTSDSIALLILNTALSTVKHIGTYALTTTTMTALGATFGIFVDEGIKYWAPNTQPEPVPVRAPEFKK